MRKIGLAHTLRMARTGNDERVTAQTALQIGLVTEVVARDQLWSRAHELAAGIAAKPSAATQGTVRAVWESLDRPYRAAMQQGLIYTRVGNPTGMAEEAENPVPRVEPRPRWPPPPRAASALESPIGCQSCQDTEWQDRYFPEVVVSMKKKPNR